MYGRSSNAWVGDGDRREQRASFGMRGVSAGGFFTSRNIPLHPQLIHYRFLVDSVWEKLERIARILGDRDSTVGSYINAILVEHLTIYADDIEIWRKL